MKTKPFGHLSDKTPVQLFILKNDKLEIAVTDYGTSLVNLIVNDKHGNPVDIALGYDDAPGYENDNGCYLGCNVGRNANRIRNGRFFLGDREYLLDKNDGRNNLHSGLHPYSKRIWAVEKYNDDSVTFFLKSPHMDQGFPGEVIFHVTYRLLEDAAFQIQYEAVPDRDTIINMTNHSYFNLNGEGSGSALQHKLTLHADSFTSADAESIPTGEMAAVINTPMDFRMGKTIGQDMEEAYEQLILAKGYDHNYVLNRQKEGCRTVAEVLGDKTGITMQIATDYPGMQLYSANYLDNVRGKNGHIYGRRDALCFEPQFFPDAINHENFASSVCRAGETYKKEIIYRFFS